MSHLSLRHSTSGSMNALLGRADLDPQPAAFALDDHDRLAAAGADLVEHGLACDAELPGGLVELDVPVGDGGHEPPADLVGQPDPPRGVLGGLLGGEQPLSKPAADRHRAHPKLAGGLHDRNAGAGEWRARCGRDVRAFADPADAPLR